MSSLGVAHSLCFLFSLPPRPFPTEESVNDDDIYKGLPDLIEYVECFQQNIPLLIFASLVDFNYGC